MFKKFMAFALSSLLLLTNGSVVFAANFSDVPESHWAHSQITTLADEGVISGYPDNTFQPEGMVTREEFSAMLVKALRQQGFNPSGCMPYTDMCQDMWSYGDVNRINDLELVVGYPDNTFRPTADITKTEAMIVLSNTLNSCMSCKSCADNCDSMKNCSTCMNSKEILGKFKDASDIKCWAKKGVSKSVKNDIYVKYPDPKMLEPNKKATRAEIADLLYQLRMNPMLMARYQEQDPNIINVNLKNEVPAVEHLQFTSASSGVNEVEVKRLQAKIVEGNVIETAFMSDFTTKNLSENAPVQLVLKEDLYTQEGTFLIPAGSVFEGRVTNVRGPKLFNRNAKAGLDLNKLMLPSGKTYDISAGVATDSGLIESGYTMRNFKRDFITTAAVIGFGAGLGALCGLTRHSGKGAIIGTYSSAGAGVLAAAIIPGYHISFKEGDKIYIKFLEPLGLER